MNTKDIVTSALISLSFLSLTFKVRAQGGAISQNVHQTVLDQKEDWLGQFDFDGDGVNDEVSFDYSGGAHCCYTIELTLSSDKRRVKYPFEMDGGYLRGVDDSRPDQFKIEDIDQDGLPEIVMQIQSYNNEPDEIPLKWKKQYGISTNKIVIEYKNGRLHVRDLTELKPGFYGSKKISYRIETMKLASSLNCTNDKTSCASITIRYPVFNGISKVVQQRLQKYFIESFINKTPGAEKCNSLQEVAQAYLRSGEKNLYSYDGEREWFIADILPQQISDTLITVTVVTDYWNYAHYSNQEIALIHFNPVNGNRYKNLIERIEPGNSNLRVQKLCPWSIGEFIDSGKEPPPPIAAMFYPIEYLPPQLVTDSAFQLKTQPHGELVECAIKRGKIRINHPSNYYRGSDAVPDYSDGKPHYEQGITQFDLLINGRKIPVSLDYIVHPHIRSIKFMSDLLTKKMFIYIPCGDGAGTAQLLLVVENGKVTGHFDWEYGYEHWNPRSNLDSFQFQKEDTCQIYFIDFFLDAEK